MSEPDPYKSLHESLVSLGTNPIRREDVDEMARRIQEWHDSLPPEYVAARLADERRRQAWADLWWTLVRELRIDRLVAWLSRRLTPPPRPEDYDFRGLK